MISLEVMGWFADAAEAVFRYVMTFLFVKLCFNVEELLELKQAKARMITGESSPQEGRGVRVKRVRRQQGRERVDRVVPERGEGCAGAGDELFREGRVGDRLAGAEEAEALEAQGDLAKARRGGPVPALDGQLVVDVLERRGEAGVAEAEGDAPRVGAVGQAGAVGACGELALAEENRLGQVDAVEAGVVRERDWAGEGEGAPQEVGLAVGHVALDAVELLAEGLDVARVVEEEREAGAGLGSQSQRRRHRRGRGCERRA